MMMRRSQNTLQECGIWYPYITLPAHLTLNTPLQPTASLWCIVPSVLCCALCRYDLLKENRESVAMRDELEKALEQKEADVNVCSNSQSSLPIGFAHRSRA